MAKDSGYPAVPAGNEIVDFVWGPQPLQPNTDRIAGAGSTGCGTGTGGSYDTYNFGGGEQDLNWSPTTQVASDLLDPTLDSHIIATGLLSEGIQPGWSGYPDFLPNDIDAVPGHTPIPYVVGSNVSFGITQLENAGFTVSTSSADNAAGATALNNGQIKSQSPAGGITAHPGDVVSIVVYNYVNPVTFQWNLIDYNQWSINNSGATSQIDLSLNPWTTGGIYWNSETQNLTPHPADNGWAGLHISFANLAAPYSNPGGLTYLNNNGPFTIASSSVVPAGTGYEVHILLDDFTTVLTMGQVTGTVTVQP